AFWNAWSRHRGVTKTLPHIHPQTPERQIKHCDNVAKTYLTYAASTTALKTEDVDPTLLKAASDDSAIYLALGHAFGRVSEAVRYKDRDKQSKASNEIEALNRKITQSENYLAELRVWLSKAYGTEFPTFYQRPDDLKLPKSKNLR